MTSPSPANTAWWQRWWRRIYWLRRDMPVFPILLRPGPMIYAASGGIGDELLTTALVKALCHASGKPVTVFTRYHDLFANNPAVRRTLPPDEHVLAAAEILGRRLYRPFGWQLDLDADRQAPPRDHILAEKARAIGLSGSHFLRPYLHLTSKEIQVASADIGPSAITIQATGQAAQWHMANKEWGVERFQALLTLLPPGLNIVQLGSATDPLLTGAIDRRGVTRRESAAYLAVSIAFVGLVGFLMHLARAVDRRAVIIFGGREHPSQSGYSSNENLYTSPACSPCWQKSLCSHDRICLSAITPDQVASAVKRILHEPAKTMAIDSYCV